MIALGVGFFRGSKAELLRDWVTSYGGQDCVISNSKDRGMKNEERRN